MMNRRLLQRSPKSAPYWVRRMVNNKILDTLSPRREMLTEIELNQVGSEKPIGIFSVSSSKSLMNIPNIGIRC